MTHIKDNLCAVNQQITDACQAADRAPNSVNLLAVSKTKPCSDIELAYAQGQKHFGENYLQESVEKVQTLRHLNDIVWHFIGPIQSNKTKAIAEHFSWVHSVDREKIITRLNEQRGSQDTPLNICLQVNISQESSKSGVDISAIKALAEKVDSCDNLILRGIMAIPQKHAPAETYQAMHSLFASLKQQYSSVDTLSMGMSNDLNLAIANGSTMVRIGTAIFGARN